MSAIGVLVGSLALLHTDRHVGARASKLCTRRHVVIAGFAACSLPKRANANIEVGTIVDLRDIVVDPLYPGTAVARMNAMRERARSLTESELSGEWEAVRRRLLWAAGLRDLPTAIPGHGFTGHSFNDAIHVDAVAMRDEVEESLNPTSGTGRVAGIAVGNRLGPGIRVASLPELGAGGSWSTCSLGARSEPPLDVAHVQFRSRIAFKLVWCAPTFTTFVLVDDDGAFLARGTPRGALPPLSERRANYDMVAGSKYARNAQEAPPSMLPALRLRGGRASVRNGGSGGSSGGGSDGGGAGLLAAVRTHVREMAHSLRQLLSCPARRARLLLFLTLSVVPGDSIRNDQWAAVRAPAEETVQRGIRRAIIRRRRAANKVTQMLGVGYTPRIVGLIGLMLRGMVMATSLPALFDPPLGLGIGAHCAARFTEREWLSCIMIGWFAGGPYWQALAVHPPCGFDGVPVRVRGVRV